MPNIKSSIKRVSVQAKKTEANKAHKSSLRTALKTARAAIADQDENAEEIVRDVIAQLDRAATRGTISKQKAARHKSQLMRALNAEEAEEA